MNKRCMPPKALKTHLLGILAGLPVSERKAVIAELVEVIIAMESPIKGDMNILMGTSGKRLLAPEFLSDN